MEKLKQGDWAKCGAYIFKFNPWTKRDVEYAGHQYDDGVEIRSEDCVKWIPEPGEWCWFWDYLGFTPTIGTYVRRVKENFLADIPNGKGSLTLKSFKYCQPLIGEIPFHLKDL